MATADEILEQIENNPELYAADQEEICTIDNDLRTITVPSGLQTVGVESDEDVRRLNFQMPKQYHEVDLSEFNIRINFMNANNQGDVYAVTDKAISGDNITFSWLVGRNALAYRGNIRFVVCLKKADAEGVVQQEFNTTVATLSVLEGLETTEAVVAENPDVIEQILQRLDELEENGGGGGTPGKDGVGIQKIEKTGTAGLMDTYTITLTDSTSYTFTVKNGEDGNPGDNGITPTIGENGNWYLGETDTGNPSRGERGDPGQKGDPGKKGDPGQTGATPDIQIGTVQTLEPGRQATASMTGTPENPVLNLGIPKGEKGDPGEGSEAEPYTLPIMSDTQLGGGKAVEKTDEDVPVAVDSGTGQLFVPAYPELTKDVEVIMPEYTNKIPSSVDAEGGIYNKRGIKSGHSLNSSGSEIENPNTYTTGFIPVKKGDIIRIQDPGQSDFDTTLVMALYQQLTDSSQNIGKNVGDISGNELYGNVSISGNILTWNTSNIGYYFWENFSYLRATVHSADAIITVNEEIKETKKYEKHLIPDVKVSEENMTFDISHPSLSGKNVVVFGDSIIGMVRDSTSVTAYLSKYTGATVYNVGFGGCRMSVHPTDGYAAFSMWALADAITSSDFTTQDEQATSGEDYFLDQLNTLKGINFDEIDYIVIHYGTNDFSGNVEIDNSDDTDSTSTLCGSLRYSLNKIIQKYPNAKIYISVPIYRMWEEEGAEVYENTNNNTLSECVDALINVAIEYHLPVIDGYNALGINSNNANYYLSDGTHLSNSGREMFGNFIGGKLIEQGNSIFPTYPESASADIPRQEMQNTDTTVTLEPNKLYIFPEMASLTVTLAEPDNSNVANEYHFFFTSGATATMLTLNDVLSDAYSIEANMKYEVSILENVAYIKGVAVNET